MDLFAGYGKLQEISFIFERLMVEDDITLEF